MTHDPSKSIAPSLAVIDGEATCSSVDVARHFQKQHKNVLADIRRLIRNLPADRLPIFQPAIQVRPNPKGGAPISTAAYRMNFAGFTLLAMGFTGARALEFKLRYIAEFERMQAELATRRAQAGWAALPPMRPQPAYMREPWFALLRQAAGGMRKNALARAVRLHPDTLSGVLHGSGRYAHGRSTARIARRVNEVFLVGHTPGAHKAATPAPLALTH